MENAGYKQSSTQKSEIVRTHTGPIVKSLYSKELAFKLWIHCKPQPTTLEWWDGYPSRWPVCTFDLGFKLGIPMI